MTVALIPGTVGEDATLAAPVLHFRVPGTPAPQGSKSAFRDKHHRLRGHAMSLTVHIDQPAAADVLGVQSYRPLNPHLGARRLQGEGACGAGRRPDRKCTAPRAQRSGRAAVFEMRAPTPCSRRRR